jgi:hypothetical protein
MSGPDDSENATSDPTIQLPYVLGRLRRLHHVLTAAQNRVQRDIAAVEQVLKTKPTK